MKYEHTQRGRWHYIGLAIAIIVLAGAWGEPTVFVINACIVAAIFVLGGFMIGSLTVRDEGATLALRFGPLSLLRKRFRYADITAVEQDRTILIGGWGIHYVPGRGWTYNIWGFDCVKLSLGKKIVRIGTDDAPGLAAFLRSKIAV
jgi:hypothetical protein